MINTNQISPLKTLKVALFALGVVFFILVIIDSIQHIQSEVYHRNGFIKLERKYPKMANKDFEKATMLMPWENHYRLQWAKSLEASAKKVNSNPAQSNTYTAAAIKQYDILIKSDPINPWFKARLGLIYHELYKENPDRTHFKKLAQALAKAATDTDKQNPLFTMHYGHFLYTYNNIDGAKHYYLKTIEYDPELLEAHYNLAAIYKQENNNDAAIEHYEMINANLKRMEASLKRNPSQLELRDKIDRFQNARIEVATHLLHLNQPDSAYDLIVLLPESVEKYELMAMYYAQQSQISNAISLYRQLIASVKKDIKQTLQRPTKNQQRVAMLNQKIKRYEENINQLRL